MAELMRRRLALSYRAKRVRDGQKMHHHFWDYSVSRSDTDTVQVTGVGFDAVIVRMRTGMDFQYGGRRYRRFFRPRAMGIETYVALF